MVYTKEMIIGQLAAMNAPRNGVVLVHSSLRAVGKVEGGAEGLLDALVAYFTAEGGLLCVPAHTWDNIENEITLDIAADDNCLGALSSVAILDKRGIRTENPTHSMVVFGPKDRVTQFVEGEIDVETPTAPNSCYGKLCTEGGYVLLVGVSHNRNTFLHSVDEMLNIPNRMDDKWIPVAVKRASGEVVNCQIRLFLTDYTEDISWRFPKYETAFRYHHCIADGFLGNAPAQLCSAVKMKETIELIYKNCGKNDPLWGEEPIPQKWYCTKENENV